MLVSEDSVRTFVPDESGMDRRNTFVREVEAPDSQGTTSTSGNLTSSSLGNQPLFEGMLPQESAPHRSGETRKYPGSH